MYDNAVIAGIPLLFVVMGLVEYSKRLGLHGTYAMLSSMLIGIVLGMLYFASQNPLQTWQDWFAAGIYGLGLGLVASGVYDAIHHGQN